MRQRHGRFGSSNFRSVRKEIGNIADEITSLGSSLGATASEETRAAIQSIRQRLESAGKAMDAGTVEEIIEENPWASVAVALAIGFVLGNLVRR
jgi:ElaB/YqjD/DUF883 family membrane-anchored ribosome-binding protein